MIIPIQDFERIANASASLILAESGKLVGKCVLFGIMGARLLRADNQDYNLNEELDPETLIIQGRALGEYKFATC